MSSDWSALQLLFDPEKVKELTCPFSFFGRIRVQGNIRVISYPFTKEQIDQYSPFDTFWDEESFLEKLLPKNLEAEKRKFHQNHKKMRLKTEVDHYIQKHFSTYYYDSLWKIALSLWNSQRLYHRFRISENRFRNVVCSFSPKEPVKIAFKAEKQGKRIKLKFNYQLYGDVFTEEEVHRFGPLIRRRDIYYFLAKKDWQILEQLERKDTYSYTDFNEKILKLLKPYPVDIDSIYTEEILETVPEKRIHISELGGDMLLFVPRWDYDGYEVEDDKEAFTIYREDRKITYKRDKKSEQETLDFLRQAHPNFKGKNQFFLTFKQASKNNWFYHFYHNQLKDNFTITGMDMLGYFRYSQFKAESKFQVIKTFDNLVTARFTTYFGKDKIAVESLQKALVEGNSFVLLKDQSLGVLSQEWMEDYGTLLRNCRIDGDEITFAKWVMLIPQSQTITQQIDRVLPENWMEKWKQWNQSPEELYAKPDRINAQLRPYQQKGFEWFNLMAEIGAGTLLADDMGLGKTLQAISALEYWLQEKPTAKFLIVCPASLIYNWKNEFEKFASHLQPMIYHGSDRSIEDFLISEQNVLITSYALVRNDSAVFSSMVWDAAVLDESHQIKNTRAQKTQAVMELKANRRILLNGTPIMNSVEDLFSQFHFLLPQLFPSLTDFRKRFVRPTGRRTTQTAMEELKMLTQPFLLRRTKEFAAPDLPAKTETTLWCEMGVDQREAYETVKNQVRNNIMVQIGNDGLQKSKLGVLQGIGKLRQLCSSPHLVKGEYDMTQVSSVKVENLIETLTTDLAQEKALVFSQFLGTMDLLKREFDKNGITYRSFSGKTSVKERIDLVNEFQAEDSDIQVFLLSLMAGNSGINLTNANYVFLLEPWWNKAVQQQAIDRVHRIGQTQKVFAYNMICKDSIEEKIKVLQDQKQSLSDEVITDDEGFLKNLSEEDIAFLFE